MRLGTLLGNDDATPVTGFAIDHRKVAPGNVFGAFRGSVVNGEDFIPAAIASGAIAVVATPDAEVAGAVHVADPDPRRAFALLAARYFTPFPETIVAVTGTNGKTSTVELTRQLWRMAGLSAASIGTLGVTTPDERVVTGLTTPDIVTFLSNMAGLKREGVTHVAYEASSHGLDQYRAEGPRVAAGAFTNLSRDHLDYHGNMDAYFAAKLRLFSEVIANDGAAVIWADDPHSAQVIALAGERGLRLMRVGKAGGELRLLGRAPTQLGQTLTVAIEGHEHKVNLPLIGAYQGANALISAALVIATGGDAGLTLSNSWTGVSVRLNAPEGFGAAAVQAGSSGSDRLTSATGHGLAGVTVLGLGRMSIARCTTRSGGRSGVKVSRSDVHPARKTRTRPILDVFIRPRCVILQSLERFWLYE